MQFENGSAKQHVYKVLSYDQIARVAGQPENMKKDLNKKKLLMKEVDTGLLTF